MPSGHLPLGLEPLDRAGRRGRDRGRGPVPAGLDARTALSHLGFEREQRQEVRAGETVAIYTERDADNELAVAAALLVDVPLERVARVVVEERLLDDHELVIDQGVIVGAATDVEALSRVRFTSADADEVADLIFVEPGDDFNLDREEIGRISAVGRPFRPRSARRSDAAIVRMSRAYRAVMQRRLEAYCREGLDGIGAYAREDDETARPGDELECALRSERPLLRRLPALLSAIGGADAGGGSEIAGVEHRLRWIKLDVEDRPTFVLAHELTDRSDRHVALLERQFFVGQAYNSAQWLFVALPTEDGTLLLSSRRVFSDRVTGIGSSATRRLGRRVLRSDLVEQLETIHAACLAE